MRALIAAVTTVALLLVTACSSDDAPDRTFGALTTSLGAALDILGWHITLSDLRFDADHAMVTVDASAGTDGHAKPEDLRFGLYGALAHPIEADGLGGCTGVASLAMQPLVAVDPGKLTGTVCLGPIREQNQVRGVYVYSARDRIAGTTVAYAAAFPVGLLPTNVNDTGVTVKTTTIDAFSADGAQLAPTALGAPDAFTGNGYMLLGLQVDGLAQHYRDDSAQRDGPLMIVVAPTLPPPGLNPACSAYGGSLLILPERSRDTINVAASLCTQGEINAALLYPTVSLIGTHAALWTIR